MVDRPDAVENGAQLTEGGPGDGLETPPEARPEGRVEAQPAWELPGAQDGFERLWTPHRLVYLQGADKPSDAQAGPQCPFCRAPQLSDEAGLIVARGRHTFVVLNLYPYNTGHAMVCPYRHVSMYPDLTGEETAELAEQTKTVMRVLQRVSGCHGFNLGMNQGAVAGAGIAAHLHQHIVPRWGGDANFLPIIASTKALPELLAETRARMAEAWPVGDARPRAADSPGDVTGR